MTQPEAELPDTAAVDQTTGQYGVPEPREAMHRPTTNMITSNLGSPRAPKRSPQAHNMPLNCKTGGRSRVRTYGPSLVRRVLYR